MTLPLTHGPGAAWTIRVRRVGPAGSPQSLYVVWLNTGSFWGGQAYTVTEFTDLLRDGSHPIDLLTIETEVGEEGRTVWTADQIASIRRSKVARELDVVIATYHAHDAHCREVREIRLPPGT